MSQNRNNRKVRFLLGMLILLTTMLLIGCASFDAVGSGDFNSKGLPNQRYLVGGGLDIQWRTPEAGTAYLVEEKTGKIVMTKTLGTGEEFEFEFSPDSVEPEETEAIFGIEMSELKFSLYFIPTDQE
jgi:hypothetical protein